MTGAGGGERQFGILCRQVAADRIVFMENGVIVEQGPPDQVLLNPCAHRTKEFLCKVTQHIDSAGLGKSP